MYENSKLYLTTDYMSPECLWQFAPIDESHASGERGEKEKDVYLNKRSIVFIYHALSGKVLNEQGPLPGGNESEHRVGCTEKSGPRNAFTMVLERKSQLAQVLARQLTCTYTLLHA